MKFQVVNIWQDNPPTWSNDYGTFDAYLLNLRGEDGSEHGSVGLNKKSGNAPPAEGAIVEGEINQTNAGPKLKIAAAASAGGGGGGGGSQSSSGGGGGGGGGFPAHVQASITYQHSQDVAVALMAILPVPNTIDEVMALHRDLSSRVAQNVSRVWEKHGGPARFGAPAAEAAPAAPAQAPAAAQGGFGTQQSAAPAQGGFGAAPGGGGFGQPAPVAGGGGGGAPADDDIPFAFPVIRDERTHNYNQYEG